MTLPANGPKILSVQGLSVRTLLRISADLIDLDSITCCHWMAVELSARHPRNFIYIPEGFAHGFQTLEDDTEVFYQMSHAYVPQSARGVRWNDPAFAIRWPDGPRTLSERDQHYLDFRPAS